MLHLLFNDADLLRPRASEIAVIRVEAAAVQRILLVQQQLQRLFTAEHVGGTQLTCERRALCIQRALLAVPGLGQGGTVGGTLGILTVEAIEFPARLSEGYLG